MCNDITGYPAFKTQLNSVGMTQSLFVQLLKKSGFILSSRCRMLE